MQQRINPPMPTPAERTAAYGVIVGAVTIFLLSSIVEVAVQVMTRRRQQAVAVAACCAVALIVCAGAFLFGFAMVPIYRITCEHILGIKLAEERGKQGKDRAVVVEDESRTISVQFVATVNRKLPWAFAAERTERRRASGQADRSRGSTRPIIPAKASSATRCRALRRAGVAVFQQDRMFLFHRAGAAGRRVAAHAGASFSSIRSCRSEVTELTLSYTFYENNVATQRRSRNGLAACQQLADQSSTDTVEDQRTWPTHPVLITSRTAAIGRSSARSACSARWSVPAHWLDESGAWSADRIMLVGVARARVHDVRLVRHGDSRVDRRHLQQQVDISFRMGMMWFIFSEVMFFAAFFGALFYARNCRCRGSAAKATAR